MSRHYIEYLEIGNLTVDNGIETSGNLYLTSLTGDVAITGNNTSIGNVQVTNFDGGDGILHLGKVTTPPTGGTPINTGVYIWNDGTNLFLQNEAGTQDSIVQGPSTTVDETVPIYNGITGNLQESNVKITNSGDDVYIPGKLTVVGLIDPTGLQLTPQAANPGDAYTFWVDSTASNQMKIGTASITNSDSFVSTLITSTISGSFPTNATDIKITLVGGGGGGGAGSGGFGGGGGGTGALIYEFPLPHGTFYSITIGAGGAGGNVGGIGGAGGDTFMNVVGFPTLTASGGHPGIAGVSGGAGGTGGSVTSTYIGFASGTGPAGGAGNSPGTSGSEFPGRYIGGSAGTTAQAGGGGAGSFFGIGGSAVDGANGGSASANTGAGGAGGDGGGFSGGAGGSGAAILTYRLI